MMRLVRAILLAVPMGCLAFAQQTPARPAETSDAPDTKAGAYYHFAMGRLYAELAGAEGNRNDYASKAIQHYEEALKLDPSANIIFEELTDLYVQTGKLKDAVNQAQEMLRQNPDNLEARRMLGRIYVRATGDSQTGKVDENNLHLAMEQYQKITEKDPKDAESWVMLGRLYRVSSNSVEAEKAFNNALKADPDNEEAITQLAVLYAELGDSKRAIEKLKSVTDRNPNERTLTMLADQYEQMNDFKNAAEVLKKAADLAPENTRIVRGLAQDLMYSDQLDEALKLYRQLAAEEPRDPQIPLNIAKIYTAKHDTAKAREALEKARKLDPQNLDVRYQEVRIFQAEGKNDQAIAAFKGILDDTAKRTYSIEDGRRRAGLLEEYGALQRSAEKYPQAIETFRQMAVLSPDAAPKASLQVVETYRQQKDYDSAIKEADAALKKNPDDRALRIEHARVLADQNKVDAAAAEIRALVKGKDADRDRETWLTLADVYEKAKRYPDVGKALDEAEKLADTNEEKVAVYFMRGAMFERMKNFTASESEFRKVLDLDPQNAGALNYLGYMLADRNIRLDEASQMIRKALEIDPDNGAYLDSMGWVLYRQGRLDEAQSQLQKALDRITTDPTVHDHLGDVYSKLGKTKEAISQWQASLKAYQSGASSDADPDEMAKVSKKLEDARVRLAQETRK